MNQTDYSLQLEKYVSKGKEIFDKLSTYPLGDFFPITIDTNNIDENCMDKLKNVGAVLYYFQLQPPFSASEIHNLINSMKSRKNDKLALPRVNIANNFAGNDILYVGKTNKNFLIRLKQHLGLLSRSTYALHLNAWNKIPKLTLHMMPFTHDEEVLLEHMENILHLALKPLLGRSGH